MSALSDLTHRQRRSDVENAPLKGYGYTALAIRWKVSKVAAWKWCNTHCTEDECAALRHNGYLLQGGRRTSDTAMIGERYMLRMRLTLLAVANGWSISNIAHGMGITPSSLYAWIKVHAPDGLADAYADYEEEAEAA
jgi:hypothetical protein